ncbi:MAG: TFIIB-type zinc ribbon-containing protein [Halanaeroarchaeum sp.]
MEIRGERECRDCGARWSYYETGAVTCPECGSVRSRGVGDRKRHTDAAVDLDLTEARSAADRSLEAAAETAVDACREYLRQRGFVAGGDLLSLDDTYLAAQELLHAATLLGAQLSVAEDEKRYLLVLLRGADVGDRPAADDVPESIRAARGLGTATAVRDYRDEVRAWLEDDPGDVVLETIGDHVTRVKALDGEVDPADADHLVAAARAYGEYCRGDEEALEAARDALDHLR